MAKGEHPESSWNTFIDCSEVMKAAKVYQVIGSGVGLILLALGNLWVVSTAMQMISSPDDVAVTAGVGMIVGLFPADFFLIHIITKLLK